MNKKKFLPILALALVLLIGGASVLYTHLSRSVEHEQLAAPAPEPAPKPDPVPEEPTAEEEPAPDPIMAPDFTVYDADGKEVRLSDYIGKPIVLNFWASWCGPCQMEMPDFHETYLELDEEIQFLMINMTTGRETQERASAFLAENNYTFPVFFDTQSDAAVTYGAYSLPTTFFINAEGHAIAQATGAIDSETLQKGIDLIRS